MKVKKVLLFLSIALLLAAILFALLYFKKENKNIVNSDRSTISSEALKELPEIKATILAAGDMLLHNTVMDGAKVYDGSYNFTPMFQEVSSIIKGYDFTLCNLDGVMSGDTKYTGYPTFNAPTTFARDLKDIGFQMVVTMNNHSVDRGIKGLLNTVDVLEQNGITPLGVKKTNEDKNYIIKDIKGIKVGFMAYSYETDGDVNKVSLNGIAVSTEKAPLLNVFFPKDYKAEIEKMKPFIESMVKESDIAIMYIHWGDEYQRAPNESQKALAKAFIELGIAVVFGDHPHTLQPYAKLKADNGNEGHVFYSLGNFISDQRNRPAGKAYTEDGLMATIELTKNPNSKKTFVSDVNYIGTWVEKPTINGKTTFRVLPVEKALMAFSDSASSILGQSLKRSKSNTDEMMKELH